MTLRPPLPLLAALALAACGPDPVDGGPCSYDTVSAGAVVAEVDTLGPDAYRLTLELAEPAIAAGFERKTLDVSAVDSTVTVGARVTVSLDVITAGTCTPVIVNGLGG